MDKVKTFIAAMKKHHFWVLSGLVLVLGLAGWYVAANQLAGEYKTNRDKVESEFKELQAITSRTEHPNETFKIGTLKLVSHLKQDVQTAWAKIYNHQKNSVLAWPKELGPEFLDWIDEHAPDANIPQDLRERYLNHVKEEFPRLLAIVDARPFWDKEEDTGGNRRRGGGLGGPGIGGAIGGGVDRARPSEPGRDYKVLWDEKNQKLIDEQLDFIGVPSTEEVRFCQENLWVYHALLNAIAQVNEGSTGHHNAKIKEIITLAVAQDASEIIGELLSESRIVLPDGVDSTGMSQGGFGGPGLGPGMGGGMGGPGMPDMPGGGMEMEGGGPGMGMSGSNRKKQLAYHRYVDEKGTPMVSAAENPPQFKRLPVVLRLRMDQREIANLLVTLANSPLPVDIRQLRINTKMSGGTASARPMMFGGGESTSSRGRSPSSMVKRDKSLEEALLSPYELNLELVGTIYIFNPPDKKAFQLDDDTAAAAEEDAAADALEHPGDAARPAAGNNPASRNPREEAPGDEGPADAADPGAMEEPLETGEDPAPRDRGPAADAAGDEALPDDAADGFESAESPADPAPAADRADEPEPSPAADEEESPF